MPDYGSLLGALGGAVGGGAPPNPAAMGIGMGAPPALKGVPPPPTGVGAMPTSMGGTDPKLAADEAVLKLRTAIGFFPNLKDQLEQAIDALKGAASKSGAGATPSALGQPSPPGTPPPEVPGPELSGSPGS